MAAIQRGWPIEIEGSVVSIGWSEKNQKLLSSFTNSTSYMAALTARNKFQTIQTLNKVGLPVPVSLIVKDLQMAKEAARKMGWPLVIKPSNQDQGRGVVPGIVDNETLELAFNEAQKFSPGAVIVEKHINGEDHRLLVVKGKMLMATKRIPGHIVGDGVKKIEELLADLNTEENRGDDPRSLMMSIKVDDEALMCLKEQGLKVDQIPNFNQYVYLRKTANISRGGSALDVTDIIHPDNKRLAERAADAIGLDIAGVDFIIQDISRSWRDIGGAICEVNAQPGFRPHWIACPERDINGEILDVLFKGIDPRIPTAAITGTNGKSTTSKMLHRIWQSSGKVTGVCTTQGVWIGDELITDKNLSGFPGAKIILNDKNVEVAIFEMPRKGLIKFGHPCDYYDVGALLNIEDDHIGVDGINTLEEMALLKYEVLKRSRNAVVINADDKLCMQMSKKIVNTKIYLVSYNYDSKEIKKHSTEGGSSVFIEESHGGRWVVLSDGIEKIYLIMLKDIPATMNGLLKYNEINSLFAIAIAWAQNISLEKIREGIKSFDNNQIINPGRYNFIKGFPYELLLDYGHNPQGIKSLIEVAKSRKIIGKKIIVMTIGNRFKHHFEEQIPWLLDYFDDIYIAQDAEYFNKNSSGYEGKESLDAMLDFAGKTINPKIRSNQKLILERNVDQIIKQALENAKEGDQVVLLAEFKNAIKIIEEMKIKNNV
jgi:cyanophycin synthetase